MQKVKELMVGDQQAIRGGEEMAENKEKTGKTIRFSVRLPKEMHRWLKDRSRNTEKYISMNRIIEEAVRDYMER